MHETGDRDLRAQLVEPQCPKLSIRKQCELLSINRSRVYYKPVPEKPENIEMMNIMDRHLTNHPTEGVVSMVYLLGALGFVVGPKRIRRLLRSLYDIQAQESYQNRSERVYTTLLVEGLKNYSCESGLVYRYYLHTDEKRLYVYDCNH